jgi:hypothetical protein
MMAKQEKKSRLLRPDVLEALQKDVEPHRSSSDKQGG